MDCVILNFAAPFFAGETVKIEAKNANGLFKGILLFL